ncbi:MAG: insulinase family protein [Acidobacteria bacterium]|nr:insulinase family protein [Acidobacteriota bacterium]MBI3662904.1 insulinase family protein [Acidobacteriota bacterium]
MSTAPLGNLAAVPALASERPVVWPRRTRRTLSNGMQVVLVESHTIPKFDAQILFRRGNAVAAHETVGLAEMTASVVRAGTTSRSLLQIEEDLRRMGADLSTSAGADTSAISFSGLSDFSAELLALAADLAQIASFPAEEFERERRQRLEEVKIERTTPGFLAGERIRQVLFGAHPYATVAPTEAQVEAYGREQLVAYYRRHYSPANALFLAVGAFSADRMMEQIECAFGSWRSPASGEPAYPSLPEIRGRRVHLVHLPGTVQAQVLVGNRAITRHHPDWMPLLLANAIYGGAFNSRLVMNIREQKGYTYSPRSAVNALRQHGYFSAHAAVRNEVTAATLTEIFYELDRMRSLPVSDDELADTKNYLSGVFSLGLATQDGLAGQLATVYLNDLPEDYLETYRDKVHALTAGDVLAAARKHFDSASAQIVVVGDRPQVEAQAALFGELDIRDAHGNVL